MNTSILYYFSWQSVCVCVYRNKNKLNFMFAMKETKSFFFLWLFYVKWKSHFVCVYDNNSIRDILCLIILSHSDLTKYILSHSIYAILNNPLFISNKFYNIINWNCFTMSCCCAPVPSKTIYLVLSVVQIFSKDRLKLVYFICIIKKSTYSHINKKINITKP